MFNYNIKLNKEIEFTKIAVNFLIQKSLNIEVI